MKQRCISGALAALSLSFAFISISTTGGTALAADTELKTAIVSATVYSGQAQVVRRGEVKLQPGRARLVCRDIPARFIESSLLVEGSGTSKARIIGIDLVRPGDSVQGSDRYKELYKEYERLNGERKKLAVEQEALQKRRDLLQTLEQYSSDKAHDELSRQTFSIQQWQSLLDYYQTERGRIGNELNSLETKIDELDRKINLTVSEIDLLNRGESALRSVAVDCEVETAGAMTIDLSYIVPDASWSPEYTILFNEPSGRMEIGYNAKIRQATGEDWKGVSVLLSTAQPQLGAAPPALNPLTVAVYQATGAVAGRVIDARTGKPLAFANVVIVGTKLSAMTMNDGRYRIADVPDGAYEIKAMLMGYKSSQRSRVLISAGGEASVNFALDQVSLNETREITIQSADLKSGTVKTGDALHVRGGRGEEASAELAPAEEPAPLAYEEVGIESSGYTANLQIKTPVDLDSGAEPRRALVVREQLRGDVSRHAVPSLSGQVFLEGTFENSLAVPLLPGVAEVYVETSPPGATNVVSTFVGRENIAGIAPEQTFTLHLGADQNVKISHELEKKEYLSKSGKKTNKIRYHYLMTVESFRNDTCTVRVQDRIPTSTNADIKVVDAEIGPEPTEQQDNGLLMWRVPLSPGGKATIRIAYTITFPGDWSEQQIMFVE